MKISRTAIPDVLLIEPEVYEDDRGYFLETWHAKAFAEIGLDVEFVQDNESRSVRGALRGLHYQIQRPQGKLVRVVCGDVFDVAVDLRRSSPTFGCWAGQRLSGANHRQMWIPPGCAHGFLVLSERADFLYKCTDFYFPAFERVLIWSDPEVGITWPVIRGQLPLLSSKDAKGLPLGLAEAYD